MKKELRGERRRRIVETARAAFAASGFGAVGMASMARDAGMAAGTLYNYFPSKESLLLAVFEFEIAELLEGPRIEDGLAGWARASLTTYARFPRERWREFMAAFYRGSPEDGRGFYSTQAPLVAALDKAIEGQRGSGCQADPRLRRVLFAVFYRGFLRWVNAGPELEGLIEEVSGDLEATAAAWPCPDNPRKLGRSEGGMVKRPSSNRGVW